MKTFRHGDVYLSQFPADVSIEPGKRIPAVARGTVLAYGEVTGHAHTLDPTKVEFYELSDEFKALHDIPDAATGRHLRVLETVNLVHEEHGPITLEPGDYFTGIQIEYDEQEEWRRVAD